MPERPEQAIETAKFKVRHQFNVPYSVVQQLLRYIKELENSS